MNYPAPKKSWGYRSIKLWSKKLEQRKELKANMQIRITDLVQKQQGGEPDLQGT